MLQLTSSLPFLQWPVPSTVVFVVVKAAPVTGLLAAAAGSRTRAAIATRNAMAPAVGRPPPGLFVVACRISLLPVIALLRRRFSWPHGAAAEESRHLDA